MSKIFHENFKFCLRAALFFGLLGALLFSSGEGIRLFPFPATETAQSEKSTLKSEAENGYKENVFRFEKGENNSVSKIQRGAKDFWADAFLTTPNAPDFKSAFVLQVNSLPNPAVFKSQVIARSKSSRAPPLT